MNDISAAGRFAGIITIFGGSLSDLPFDDKRSAAGSTVAHGYRHANAVKRVPGIRGNGNLLIGDCRQMAGRTMRWLVEDSKDAARCGIRIFAGES
jgi:hypothetical protein